MRPNTVIESLGVYLPPHSVSTSEVMSGCKRKVRFPLEYVTGIKSRRMAQGEFSMDLAIKAVADCLAQSKYHPEDIDLVVCCNISRYDAPDVFSFEPGTAVRLRAHFGFVSALTLDITNACAGVFTAIYLVDSFLKAGVIRRGMVVSGEYITHLTKTAQREMKGFADPRLACLTLGDSGIALILETGPDNGVGFHAIEIYTLSQHSGYCIAKASDKPGGGAIMLTDVVKLSAVAIREATAHAVSVQSHAGWPPELMDHLIMHQTSERTIREAAGVVNDLYRKRVCTERNTVCNVGERGNTATTTHFVAFRDHALRERIQPGHNILFSVNASGLTIGTAVYKCDDLPVRIRGHARNERHTQPASHASAQAAVREPGTGIRIESIGILPDHVPVRKDTVELSRAAAEACLERSRYDRAEIDVLIYAGIYRTGYVSEPALAAMIAGELAIAANGSEEPGRHTLCFDIISGSAGFLKACCCAARLIQAGRAQRVMIVASEIECNSTHPGKPLLGLRETGSAMILDAAPGAVGGFRQFAFRDLTEHLAAFRSYCDLSKAGGVLEVSRDPQLERLYVDGLADLADEYLERVAVDRRRIRAVLGPQMGPHFAEALGGRLGIPVVDASVGGCDLYTSSLPYAFEYAFGKGMVRPGDLALVLAAGSGVQLGGALYEF
jgi:3-oxoacyl-[acyl-carrier-protein] synthase III